METHKAVMGPAMEYASSIWSPLASLLDQHGSKDFGLLVVKLSGDTQSPANRDHLLS